MNRVTLFRTLGRLYGPARSLAAAALLGTAVLGSQAFAQDPVSIENDEFQDFTARDSAGYWTSTELSRAQLQELLVPSLGFEELIEEAAAQPDETPLGFEAKDGFNIMEAAEVEPDLEDRLFPVSGMSPELLPSGGEQLEDMGTQGTPFSSSRLVPTNARLT